MRRSRHAEPRRGGGHPADGQAEPGGAAAGRAVPQLRPAGRRRRVLPAAAGAGDLRRAGGGAQVRQARGGGAVPETRPFPRLSSCGAVGISAP